MNKGFSYMGKCYLWKNKELYRLPFQSRFNFYGVKKCTKWKDGYLLGGQRKSLAQLEAMTVSVDYDIDLNVSSDCPF